MMKQKIVMMAGIFLIASTSVVLSGCDNGSSAGSSSSDSGSGGNPTPNPPDPVVPGVPEASNLSIRSLFTNGKLKGTYQYSDVNKRAEGNSVISWLNSSGETIGNADILSIDPTLYNQNVKYCVTPVTYDGVEGKQTCSAVFDIKWDTETVAYSTDWNTDTDYINDSANNDVRNGPSGNVHFYYNMNIQPVSTDAYSLDTLSTAAETTISRNFYDGFNIDDIYVDVNVSGEITLTNNTPRTVKEPIIRINDDYYYQVTGYTLKPFTTVKIVGYSGNAIKNITFVDPSPAYKLNVEGFWQGEDELAHPEGTPFIAEKIGVKSMGNSSKEKGGGYDIKNSIISLVSDNHTQYGPVNESLARQYTQYIIMAKLLYNRFDTMKLFFDSMNGYQGLDGTVLGTPFDNVTSTDSACAPELLDPTTVGGLNVCGANNVVAPYAYRLHALKRLLSNEPDTLYKHLAYDDMAEGRSDIDPRAEPGTLGITTFSDAPTSMEDFTWSTVSHESSHRMGYSDGSGLTYGWANGSSDGPLDHFQQNLDYYHLDSTGSIDLTQPVVETSHYFADYHWVDNKTVDVTFYSKGDSSPLKNIAVLAEDEQSGRSFPNFFGTWNYCESSDWSDPTTGDISDCETYSSVDWDGSLRATPDLTVINNHTIRITLQAPIENYSKTLMVFASSADTNNDVGIWKTNYQQSTADSVAIQIPYDQEMNTVDTEHNVAYVTALQDFNVVRGGSTGHIGGNGVRGIVVPNYYLPASFYRSYNADDAAQHCKDLGYAGLGVIPYATGTSSSDPLGNLIYKYVYDGVMIGLSNTDRTSLQIIKGQLNNTHPVSIEGNPATDNANLLVCAL
jgi:hypothetical protein